MDFLIKKRTMALLKKTMNELFSLQSKQGMMDASK